ncbi:MAG: acyl-CoA/acyl-ACP dehydrogenase [Hydrogenibacillus sp.]|nr:acyl-CoA/acyl-ACP dehydrogenase [Hydrogenibacillus sp.]
MDTLGMRATASHDVVPGGVRSGERFLGFLAGERRPGRIDDGDAVVFVIPAVYLGIAQWRDAAVHFAKTYRPNSLGPADRRRMRQKIGEMERF